MEAPERQRSGCGASLGCGNPRATLGSLSAILGLCRDTHSGGDSAGIARIGQRGRPAATAPRHPLPARSDAPEREAAGRPVRRVGSGGRHGGCHAAARRRAAPRQQAPSGIGRCREHREAAGDGARRGGLPQWVGRSQDEHTPCRAAHRTTRLRGVSIGSLQANEVSLHGIPATPPPRSSASLAGASSTRKSGPPSPHGGS